jgi:hypothetical protein
VCTQQERAHHMSRARTSTFCWPTQAIICEMLMKEPLLPLVTILMMLLSQLRLFCAVLPARAVACVGGGVGGARVSAPHGTTAA